MVEEAGVGPIMLRQNCGRSVSGSLVPPDFGARQGTAAPLMLQTCMNSTVTLVARPAFISFSPGKKAMPRQLRITLWQTRSWTKKIIELRKRSGTPRETETMRQSFYDKQKTKVGD